MSYCDLCPQSVYQTCLTLCRRYAQHIRRNVVLRDPDNPLDHMDKTEILRK